MSQINAYTTIRENKEIIYDLLKNLEKFPTFVHDIKSIRIIRRQRNVLITEWMITIDGVDVIWTEEDTFVDQDTKIKFRMLEGDYDSYEGEWTIEDTPTGVRLRLFANIDWGAPRLVRYVKPILERKTRQAFKTFLMAIKKEIERKR